MWEMDYKESWVPKNWSFWTVVLEKTLESSLDWKEIKLVHSKEISPEYTFEGTCWFWNSNTLANWCKELTHCKKLCCWKWLKAGGEGDNRGWDGWMSSLTQWIWICCGLGSPACCSQCVSKESYMVWATELNWSKVETKEICTYSVL